MLNHSLYSQREQDQSVEASPKYVLDKVLPSVTVFKKMKSGARAHSYQSASIVPKTNHYLSLGSQDKETQNKNGSTDAKVNTVRSTLYKNVSQNRSNSKGFKG